MQIDKVLGTLTYMDYVQFRHRIHLNIYSFCIGYMDYIQFRHRIHGVYTVSVQDTWIIYSFDIGYMEYIQFLYRIHGLYTVSV